MELKKIKSALISVYYKDGLEDIVRALDRQGVTIYSTGGTYKFINDLGITPVAVESLTGYPSILGGRVKTLHPKVFGGILSRRDMYSDGEQLAQYEIPEIDLVIVDLYPFEATVASNAPEQDIIEKIDIGGISLIRAAAKNYKDAVIVPAVNHYSQYIQRARGQHHLGATQTFRCLRLCRKLPLRHGHLQLLQPAGTNTRIPSELQSCQHIALWREPPPKGILLWRP